MARPRKEMAEISEHATGKLVAVDEVFAFVKRCMVKVGAAEAHAASQAELLVTADSRGHFSHGLNRLGKCNASATPTTRTLFLFLQPLMSKKCLQSWVTDLQHLSLLKKLLALHLLMAVMELDQWVQYHHWHTDVVCIRDVLQIIMSLLIRLWGLLLLILLSGKPNRMALPGWLAQVCWNYSDFCVTLYIIRTFFFFFRI